MTGFRSSAAIVVALGSVAVLHAGPASLSPDRPRFGQSIEVAYDTADSGATLEPGDRVFAVAFVCRTDGRSETRGWRMKRDGPRLSLSVPIGEDYAHLTFYFVTPDGWDSKTSISTPIYTSDGSPARTARQNSMTFGDFDRAFRDEIERYPDNFAAYRDRWFYAIATDADAGRALLEEDLGALAAIETESASLLFVRTYGHLVLGDEPAARTALLSLLERHPLSPYTERAVADYEYQTFAQQLKDEGPELVQSRIRALVAAHPAAGIAREKLLGAALDPEFPFATIEQVAASWIAAIPQHPVPRLALAAAWQIRGIKPDEGAEAAARSIDSLFAGDLRLLDDVSGRRTEMYLSMAYRTAAEIALSRRRLAEALAFAQAVRRVQRETLADPDEIEAEVWRAAGHLDLAERSLVSAWRAGSKTAEGALRDLYIDRRGASARFDAWWTERRAEAAQAADGTAAAPTFSVDTLDRSTLDSGELRGKVVVLNFWFTGCAPCVVEIPGLNRLVERYGTEGVVFIAFALDDAQVLRSFLVNHPFRNRVVAAARDVAGRFGVSAWPTHVIVDRGGWILARKAGGNAQVEESLVPLIDRALGR